MLSNGSPTSEGGEKKLDKARCWDVAGSPGPFGTGHGGAQADYIPFRGFRIFSSLPAGSTRGCSLNLVLIISDRPEQARSLSERLGVAGIEAIPCASDWRLAVRCLTSHNISLIVLSIGNSPEHKALFQTLRDLTEVPVVAMGVGKDAGQVVWYLEQGAADYVTPTMPVGVLAGKLALLLRPRAAQRRTVIGLGDLVVDIDRRTVTRGRKTVSLTPLEFTLLQVLAENAGRACSRQMLLEKVWGQEFRDCTHYLRLYIGYLRQKLELDPGRPRHILTEWGYGYRLVEPKATGRQPSLRPGLRPAPSP